MFKSRKAATDEVGFSQMQDLQEEKEHAERSAENMRALMGKGKWVERASMKNGLVTLRLLSSHVPYQEFLLFVAHLRSVHLGSAQPPAMSTLLPLPFLTRLLTEDSCVAMIEYPCLSLMSIPGNQQFDSTWHHP